VSGHDFSRAERSPRELWALQAAEKGGIPGKWAKNIPPGLKPTVFLSATYGTTKVVPFQNIEFFRSL
jgi:hypothetical protein